MKEISIIIPHYNSVELLKRCLKSIPNSSDIEVIVVDDNSPLSDEQEERLKSYESNNVTIIFNKESKGAGHARNIGLSHANSKWIVFSDADDLFTDDAFKIFLSHYDDTADIIYFLTDHVYSDSLQLFDDNCMGLNDLVKLYDGTSKSTDAIKYGICVPWGRMYRTSMIKDNRIEFDEVRYGNDTMFSMKTAYNAKDIAVDLRTVYLFTVNRGSLTHKVNKDSISCRMEVDLRKNQMMREIGKPQCQVSVTPHIYQASKFGINFTIQMFILALKYKCNPFKGSIGWIVKHYKNIEVNKARRKYESE